MEFYFSVYFVGSGSDAIILGAETLRGLYPVETVSTVGKICAEVNLPFMFVFSCFYHPNLFLGRTYLSVEFAFVYIHFFHQSTVPDSQLYGLDYRNVSSLLNLSVQSIYLSYFIGLLVSIRRVWGFKFILLSAQ